MAFEEMGVLQEIAKRVQELEWMLPTDVQAEAIPLILGGGDVLMAAETGSGKTGAFCLPILQIVWESRKDLELGKGWKMTQNKDVAAEKCTLSAYDRSPGIAIAEGRICQSRETQWNGVRASRGVVGKGRYYYEATVRDEGLCRVGWSTYDAVFDIGTDKLSFGYGGTGKKSNNKQFDDYGEPYGLHDVIGCLLDLDNMEISFTKNGQHLGLAFKLLPYIKGKPLFPSVCLKNAEIEFNFGETPFKHGPPKDYVGVANAPAECNATNINEGGGAPVSKKQLPNAPQAIVIEPSRELAEQTLREINNFKKYLENPVIKTAIAIGGVPVKDQIAALNDGVDIVVGTPGRLEELINSGSLLLTHCRFFVLDEADGLLQQGHGDLIKRVHAKIPKLTSDGKRLQMIVCSATLHSVDVKKMADRLMHFPTWVDLKGEDSVPETVHHVVVPINPISDRTWAGLKERIPTDGVHSKDRISPNDINPEMLSEMTKILKGEYCVRAIDTMQMDQAIIFCRTKVDCDNLETFLKKKDAKKYTCVCLHADRKPNERKDNLEAFKQKKAKFLICTDVAARGLDIAGLPFMINMTLPDEKSNYLHRIGRVGRAERMGLAISLVSTVPEKVWFHGEWCPSRGRSCNNTSVVERGGCCVWINEMNLLAEVEEHLGVTVQQVGTDMKIPVDEYDGKVVYGQKRKTAGSSYETHVAQMAPAVQELAALESHAQCLFLKHQLYKARY